MTSALLTSGEYNKAPIKKLKRNTRWSLFYKYNIHTLATPTMQFIHSHKINPNAHTHAHAVQIRSLWTHLYIFFFPYIHLYLVKNKLHNCTSRFRVISFPKIKFGKNSLQGEKQRRCLYIWIAGADQARSRGGKKKKKKLPSLPLTNLSFSFYQSVKRKRRGDKKTKLLSF